MKRIIWLTAMFSLVVATISQASIITSFQATSDDDALSTDGWSTVSMNFGTSIPGYPDEDWSLLVYKSSDAVIGEVRSALEFNISSLPSNINIVSAELSLYGFVYDNNIGVHGYVGNGVVDPNDFMFFNLGVPIATFDPGLGLNAVDVTTGVMSLYGAGASFAGFQLLELALDDPTLFRSSEFLQAPTTQPRLTIVYSPIPEPSTFFLLGGGLIGLAFAVRRRRKE